jgi:signal transduction histidine kinase
VRGTLGVSRDRPGCPYTADDVVLLQDLADRAAMALEAARRFEQSLTALGASDDVLAAVSHDLKTPLTAISGSAQLLRRQLARTGTDDERLVQTIERITDACRRMAGMMGELVDTARLEAGQTLVLHPSSTDLVALVRAAVADQETTAEGRSLRVSAPSEIVTGAWDGVRLRRVLDNVLSNAIKYSRQGGEVCVDVAIDHENGCRWAVVRVKDEGVGIPVADLPHIFERFRRARNVAGIAGTGIGLSAAKQIVEQHGGRLEVDSCEGAGSTFTVRLPLSAEHR